ncbi:hypothetical protein L21SP5_03080 [Salinivirga cyanobacteriivorans]|uniref:Uncharacterized protein n=1 Tax=Salinivirga cyanobacteriivorans TaxID=1307839 RepID=A0A0S2I3Z9_9BACT|nr:hypothetical protein [Salinivirga cyanobacteriivorans]ALO16700.1 hypothetical protein L21SP5_03080 [Salinivirga cyanobacteriivorans]
MKGLNVKKAYHKYIKHVLLLSILLSCKYGISQGPPENHEKYKLYKAKLENHFLIKSDPLTFPHYGTYIPAHKRNPYDGFPNSGEIHWTDAGHTIGFYLATLATEYALLAHKKDTQSMDKTITDIVNVLRTIERLDYLAEIRYGKGAEKLMKVGDSVIVPYPYPKGSLNGFFIRDDVSRIEIFTDSAPELWSKKGIKTFVQTPKLSSDYGNHGEMSQDQVWNLMQGLALTQKLVKTDEKFMDGKGELVKPGYWAQKITYRIARTMQTRVVFDLFGVPIPVKLWAIVNPATGEIVRRGGKPVDLIFNARLFGYAMNEITAQKFGDLRYGLKPQLMLTLPLPGHKHFNDHAKLALATISQRQYAQSFDSLLYWCYCTAQSYNKGMPESYQMFSFVHFPLIYLILHKPNIDYNNPFYHYFLSYIDLRLNQAPEEGQWRSLYDVNNDGNINKDDHPEPFWSAGKRLVKPVGKDYVINKNDPATRPWEYNGLDYMLLYNLFELVKIEFFNQTTSAKSTTNFVFNGWQDADGQLWKKVDKNDLQFRYDSSIIPFRFYGKKVNSDKQAISQ